MVNETQRENEEEWERGRRFREEASRVLIIKFSKPWEREKSQKESEKKRHIK